ncbi:hypothetical protein FEI13_08275 [Halomonas urmiana]|uniref:Uncharacterized protein n=1 Tax=Halomonas urmiana TaxID=490901 RepID=A0A5R8MI80_9GAMM|nr:hypothetical protein [Halomonas urmiana]TLF51653.1 hypothetical protein FEI13_08275 [Halomonas urmiana]
MNYDLKNIDVADMTDDFNAEEPTYLITADVYAGDNVLGHVEEFVKQGYVYREGMGRDYQGWEVDTSADSAFGVGNNDHILEGLDYEDREEFIEKVILLLQEAVDKELNIGYLDLSPALPGAQAIAKEIKDFVFEPGCNSGHGEYKAVIQIGSIEFIVDDLFYEYGEDAPGGHGSKIGIIRSSGCDIYDDSCKKIQMAAQSVGLTGVIELGEGDIEEIMNELESQIEDFVEENYDQTIKAMREAERSMEKHEDIGQCSQWGDVYGM